MTIASSSSSRVRVCHHADDGEAEINAEKIKEDVTPGGDER